MSLGVGEVVGEVGTFSYCLPNSEIVGSPLSRVDALWLDAKI